MHLFKTLIIPLMGLAVSPAFSAPILPNVDALEARSINDASMERRFMHDSSAATALLPQAHFRRIVKRENPNPKPVNGVTYSIHVGNLHDQPLPKESEESKVSKRDARTGGAKPKIAHKWVPGRIVSFGKKLARLFYHGRSSKVSAKKNSLQDGGGDYDRGRHLTKVYHRDGEEGEEGGDD